MKKLLIAIGLLVGLASLGFVLNSILNPTHRDIKAERASFLVPAAELQYFFAENEVEAVGKYMDKVLEVSGQITEVAPNSIILDKRVQVNFLSDSLKAFDEGDRLTIKGRCIGFDELLSQVKIDQATIIK